MRARGEVGQELFYFGDKLGIWDEWSEVTSDEWLLSRQLGQSGVSIDLVGLQCQLGHR